MKYYFPLWSVTALSNCLIKFTRGNNAGDTNRVSNSNQTFDVRAWKVPQCRTVRRLSASCSSTASSVSHCCICRPPVVVGCLLPNFPTCVGVQCGCSNLLPKAAEGGVPDTDVASSRFPAILPEFSMPPYALPHPWKHRANMSRSRSWRPCLPVLFGRNIPPLPRQLYSRADHDRGAITHHQQKFFHGHIYIATVPVQTHQRVVQIRQQECIHVLTSHDTQQLVGLFLVANFCGRPVPALRI